MPDRSNIEEFVKKARIVHRNKYDYSLANYTLSRVKINIVCPDHGLFKMVPNAHLRKQGCPKCGRHKTVLALCLNQTEFLKKAVAVHGNKYDYSRTDYKNSHVKLDIICTKHGLFQQTPTKHMAGQGCPRCARELPHYNSLTTKTFIEKAKAIHGNKYDYSLVAYRKSCKKIKILCPDHGLFEQSPNNHLMGMKCVKCALKINADSRKYNTQEFIRKAMLVHKNKYDYSEVDYKKCEIKIKIKCHNHGVFIQTPASHLAGKGCPFCLDSQGELKISDLLNSMNIKYEREKKFTDCKNIRLLPFDFYIPSMNACIEYDGKQHFNPVDYYGGITAYEDLKKKDAIKNRYCLNNEIKLIRIPYTKKSREDIEDILKRELTI